MKRYEEVRPEPLEDEEFIELMGKLMGHALAGAEDACLVAASCRTVAHNAREMALRDGADAKEWDEKVDAAYEGMKNKAVHMVEDGEERPQEPPDILEERGVTDDQLRAFMETAAGPLVVFRILGTSGKVSNVLVGSLLLIMENELRSICAERGGDAIDWRRQVRNARDRMEVVIREMTDQGTTMPPGTVRQKGGDA